MNHPIAQVPNILPGNINGIGPLGKASGAESTLAQVISGAIGLITFIAFISFAFILMTGAIAVITAGGDKAKLADARGKLSTGVIGLVVTVAAWFLVDLIARLLGISGIFNVAAMIDLIAP